MIRHTRQDRVLAICLATLAGYVDALGFLHLGGYFVSFMTGNSTRLGVGFAERAADALLPLGLIVLFVAGVVAGSLAARAAADRRPSRVLALVAALLLAAALCAQAGLTTAAIAATPVLASCGDDDDETPADPTMELYEETISPNVSTDITT